MSNNREHAIQFATKLDFYFIALVFTILGLSIQTGTLDRAHGQFIFEIAAWTSLLISGLAGLSKLELTPMAYIHIDERNSAKENLAKLDEPRGTVLSRETQRPIPPDELTHLKEKLRTQIDHHSSKFEGIERGNKWKYYFHKWGFVIGLILLIASRALHGLSSSVH